MFAESGAELPYGFRTVSPEQVADATISAVELSRQTSAGVAIYARGDSLPQNPDSIRVSLLAIDATTTKVLFGVIVRWPAADPEGLAARLADHVRHNHPVKPAL